MKLVVVILLLPTAMALPGWSSAQTWLASFQQPLKNPMEDPLPQSTVPEFILATRHPWILANRHKFESIPNAEAILCSYPNSELSESTWTETDTYRKELEIPPDVFEYLEIDNNRIGSWRPGWPFVLNRLGEIKRCQRALTQVKTLKVDIYVHNPTSDPYHPPEQVLTHFGDVLESMTSLETLKWDFPKEGAHLFEEAFKTRNLTLPSIKHLEPGPSSYYLVGICPNLERLENRGGIMWHHGYMPDGRNWGLMLIQAAVSTPKLKRFAMDCRDDGWTPLLVSEIIKSMPQIESLGLYGSLGDWGLRGYISNDSRKLKAALDILTRLKRLAHLDLSDPLDLGLGYNIGPICGNFYDGMSGEMIRREDLRETAEGIEQAGNMVVANLPLLTSFTIGGGNPNITRTERGMVSATWPWTGRMDKWLMEEVPDPDAEDIEYGGM